MFGLIRRISSSYIPRPDRPWEDDPTSNAPTRRKRRLSTTERESAGDDEQTRKKKLRGEDPENPGNDDIPSSPAVVAAGASDTTNEDTAGEPVDTIQREGSLEVKVVTKGVNEVELEDKPPSTDNVPATAATGSANVLAHLNENTPGVPNTSSPNMTEETSATVNPATIPLPEDKPDELDEIPSSPHFPEISASDREDSLHTIAPDSSEAAGTDAPLEVNDNGEIPAADVPSRPETPRQTRLSRSSASSSAARKLRSKSPKKISARA